MTETIVKKPVFRFTLYALALVMMAAVLIKSLYDITVVNGDAYYGNAKRASLNTIKTKGRRGAIRDRNGLVLAYDEICFDICFMRDGNKRSDYDSAVYTDALIKAIGIINEAGMETIDTSYIRMDEDGEYYYNFGSQNERTIFSRYRNFCNACGFNMKDKDDMSTWISAEDAYLKLRKLWFIPEEMPFSEALKIISVRQEVLLNDYRSYEPVVIAADVGEAVMARIEMERLPGIETRTSTRRVYPYGMTAAHILGYCQRLNEENAQEYLKLGYSYDDKIGVSGIEATMESYLTGATNDKQGRKVIRTNANKSIVEVVSVDPPTDGSDIMLTIDLSMQKAAEAALENVIKHIYEKQLEKVDPDRDGKYNNKYSQYDSIELAKTGAIVVMDVNTGDVLALASYPAFDPNWFANGLTKEQEEYLFTGEDADKLTPTRNKAISMKLAPGSIFKMCTGFAGLMENAVSIFERIDDESPYYVKNPDTGELINNNPVNCWTQYPERHAAQTIVEALKNSCNYYFCEVANRIGIDALAKWAERFGLADKTGIELTGESIGIIGGQSALYDSKRAYDEQDTALPVIVHRALVEKLRGYQQSCGIESDEDDYSKCAQRIMQLQDGSLDGKGEEVRRILSEELGIPDGISRSHNWVNEIMSILNEIQWKPTLTIRTGIGQSIMLVTPIAAARYAAAIANGGTVYDAHIVKSAVSASGELILNVEPTIFGRIDAPKEYWKAIKRGMAEVVSPEDGGTAGDAFGNEFAEKGYLSRISGKTGSAQVGNTTVDVQNTGWFVAFAPNDDPDIAVCVCVPNGYSGSSTAGAIEEIMTYYFSKLETMDSEKLNEPDSVHP